MGKGKEEDTATKSHEPCRDNRVAEKPIFTLCSRNAIRLGEDHPNIVEAPKVAEAMRTWRNRKSPD